MRTARIFPVVALLLAGLPATGEAAPAPRGTQGKGEPKLECLTPAQRRDLVAARKVVPLATAIKAVREMPEARAPRTRARSDIIGARLCKGPDGLVYRLTVLARDGKVVRLAVDAITGKPVGGE
jgi:hypothetical protein